MPDRIHLLSIDLANRIAAGEVVERPASVVKELVENAIDAGSSRIAITVDQGGTTGIRVVDNGQGMGPKDAQMAFERHATSKLQTADDLDRILSLGFRGEALSSIAAVSRLVLRTKERGEAVGTRVTFAGGVLEEVSDTGCPEGTDILVSDLFYNVPARKKFLKTVKTEFGHVLHLISEFGLAYPEVHFQLTHSGRTVMDLPPVKALIERVIQIYGEELARHLVEVLWQEADLKITGFVSSPVNVYPDRNYQQFFVNGRSVRNPTLGHAVAQAFQDLIPGGRYPAALLFIQIAPEAVDVNVHPTKREIRFRDSARIHGGVVAFIRRALGEGREDRFGNSRESLKSAGPSPFSSFMESAPVYTRVESQRADWPTAGVPWKESSSSRFLKSIRVLGQVHQLYLLAEIDDELQMIDQHAAHERILYDRLKAQHRSSAIAVQRLLFPVPLELSPQEGQTLQEILGLMGELGFEIDPFGGQTFILRAVPLILAKEDPARLVREVIARWSESGVPVGIEELLMELTGRRACRLAVRGGMSMALEAMQSLIEQLHDTEMPYTCPHGRPIVWRLSRQEIEKKFGRT